MDWQLSLTLAAVLAAAAYLGWAVRRWWSGGRAGCQAGSCGAATSSPAAFIPASQVRLRSGSSPPASSASDPESPQ